MIERKRISIRGRVQGVGCRPFVYRLAKRCGLGGVVYNDTSGVTIEAQGQGRRIDEFLALLKSDEGKPPLLEVASCEVRDMAVEAGEKDFTIRVSDAEGTPVSEVTIDTAVCDDCLAELGDEGDFRYRYPFINCTNCGPRYTIVKTIPYDRGNTTMAEFAMCDECGGQYGDVGDRRFHAQPVACPVCGPKIWLADGHGETIERDSDRAIAMTAKLLGEGKIAAIKGLGGFHLAVDALNNAAVERLRQRKRRDHKPFAMMAADVETIRRYAVVNGSAEGLLKSPQCPIVLLPRITEAGIGPAVASGVSTLGFMLCYAPLHHLLFAEAGVEVLVMTSANISDEPLIRRNEAALEKLSGIADVFLMHDREIYRQVDDTVVHIVDEGAAILRRARGYVPTPIRRRQRCGEHVFAAGADMKNTFCFVKEDQYILSEHIGDLEDALVCRHYKGSVRHLQKLFELSPVVAACDLHPGYLSTQYAQSLEAVRLIRVQHHWAHIASVMAENDHDGEVIGIAADGTGFGTDGAIWGCECLIASLEDFERIGHLRYFSLPGADKGAKEAIYPVIGLMKGCSGVGPAGCEQLVAGIESNGEKRRVIAEQVDKGINTVQTSSLGRLFDAVAAIAGLGSVNHFEGQLPMALEAVAADGLEDCYELAVCEGNEGGGMVELDWRGMLGQVIEDRVEGVSAGVISARFHNGLAKGLLELAKKGQERSGLDTVALSGGVFCNRYLSNRLIKMLKKNGFSVLFNRIVPANDGGIALGQAAIAARMCGKV